MSKRSRQNEDHRRSDDATEFLVELGRRIEKARRDKGMDRREFAAAAGLDPRTITGIEEGRQEPTFRTIRRIITAAGVDAETIFGDIDYIPGRGRGPGTWYIRRRVVLD